MGRCAGGATLPGQTTLFRPAAPPAHPPRLTVCLPGLVVVGEESVRGGGAVEGSLAGGTASNSRSYGEPQSKAAGS